VSTDAYRHILLTANMSHSAFAESKTMEIFHPDMSLSVFFVISRFSWSVVVVSHFFVVSQRSSWSSWLVDVVSRSSWMVLILYGGYAHVFTETYGWGKPRSMSGQMYGG